MALDALTISTWTQVGDFMLRSDGLTVEPVSMQNGALVWTLTLANGQPFTVAECRQAYSSPDAAMLIADALSR